MYFLISAILSCLLFGPVIDHPDSTNVKPAPKALQELLNDVLNQQKENHAADLEIDGLLVDNTKTKLGRDFYDQFYALWEPPQNAKNYTITIEEKPYRFTTTLITVLINDHQVYRSVLSPRHEIIEDLSKQATSYVYNYLQNYEEIMRQLNGKDQSGTGIY